jgi:hypothetical protein
MADGFVINDTLYNGEAASQFILKSITGADTVNGGNVHVEDGIKYKFTIPRWDADYTDFIQDRAAVPTSKGQMTVDGATLQVNDYMIYTEFNPRDFEAHWFATQMNPALIDAKLPNTVESVVVQGVLARHAKFLNKLMWTGKKTNTDIYKYMDGFINKAQTASDTNVCSSPTTLTSSNINTEMKKVYDAIPLALRYDVDFKFFVSYKTFDLWTAYQQNQTYKGIDPTQQGVAEFWGKKVVRIADFPDDVIVGAKGLPGLNSNLWLGLNSVSDEGLQLMKLQNNAEIWFIKMLMKADVQFGFTSEVVLYGSI